MKFSHGTGLGGAGSDGGPACAKTADSKPPDSIIHITTNNMQKILNADFIIIVFIIYLNSINFLISRKSFTEIL